MNPYESDVRILKGIGDAKAKLLLRLGISSVGDLLEHYPVRFEDRRTVTPIFSCEDGASVCVTARVVTPVSENYVQQIHKGYYKSRNDIYIFRKNKPPRKKRDHASVGV